MRQDKQDFILVNTLKTSQIKAFMPDILQNHKNMV